MCERILSDPQCRPAYAKFKMAYPYFETYTLVVFVFQSNVYFDA